MAPTYLKVGAVLALPAAFAGYAFARHLHVQERSARVHVTPAPCPPELFQHEDAPAGTPADFKALVLDHARDARVRVTELAEASADRQSFRIRVEGAQLEAFIRFLVSVEQDWPKSFVREVPDLTRGGDEVWNGQVVVDLRGPKAGSRDVSALAVLREVALAAERLGPRWGIEATQMRVSGREGDESQFALHAPSAEAGIALERELEKSRVCEARSNARSDPQNAGTTRIDLIVTVKKTAGS
jgi:hypothetical protein